MSRRFADIDATGEVPFDQLEKSPGRSNATPEQPHLIPNTTRQSVVFA